MLCMHVKDFKEMNAASQADVSSCMVDWTLQSCGFNSAARPLPVLMVDGCQYLGELMVNASAIQ